MVHDVDILRARILIVDDTLSNVELLEKILEVNGYTSVLSTTDSREVMDLYEGFQPDIVLLDINMPYLNGYQVMAQLKEKGACSPILVITAQNDKETCIRSLKSGAKDFLSKPFNQIEISIRIRNILETRLLHNQIRYHNEMLEDKIKVRTRELHDTRMEIIHRLGLASEYRDNETGFHIIRVSKISQLLGKEFRLADDIINLLLHASPMHDVGKIGVKDRVLLKSDKLDPEEWDIMKTHTSIGARMLSGHSSELMVMAKTIANTHHEKWDGSGYPHGLKGEQIPLSGRIVAIADVFDALTSERPYKKAWNTEDAVVEINRCKGSHFDPELVDMFNTSLDGIISIKEQYKEPENNQIVA